MAIDDFQIKSCFSSLADDTNRLCANVTAVGSDYVVLFFAITAKLNWHSIDTQVPTMGVIGR